ncbi:MAG: hypothetical protein HOQ27_04665, partial [Dermatophilaceae bacterium]|nr:hypothetical protein [Dermatophilaceae bacterium]
MIEPMVVTTTARLDALVSELSRVGSVVDTDQVRVDQLAASERVMSAAAAAQALVTAAFVDSQQQVAQAWRERARECSEAGDFEGWRAAREQARAASLTDGTRDDPDPADGGHRRRRGGAGL